MEEDILNFALKRGMQKRKTNSSQNFDSLLLLLYVVYLTSKQNIFEQKIF